MTTSQLKEYIREIVSEIMEEKKKGATKSKAPQVAPKKAIAQVAPPHDKVTPLDAIRLAQKAAQAEKRKDSEDAKVYKLAQRAANAMVQGRLPKDIK